jgi:DnaJ family protein B protein 13
MCPKFDLFVTLEEIAHGAIKAVTHTRRVLDQHGNKVLEQRSLAVDVKPGAPDGAMFVFKG